MKENINLNRLIEKYKKGIISDAELTELAHILNTSVIKPEDEKFLKLTWNECPEENYNVHSEKLWYEIQNKTIKKQFQKKTSKTGRYNFLYKLSGYAAVGFIFIIASWMYITHIQSDNNLSELLPTVKEYTVPYGSKSKLLLSDGTQIWLNSGSKLRFEENYNISERIVYLEGEAFFDVTPNKEKPFYVKTDNINIRVYGTSFNVKAFKEDETIETTLISGSVMLEKKDENGTVIRNVQMQPNQIASYSNKNGKITLKVPDIAPPPKSDIQSYDYQSDNEENQILPEIKMAIAWKDNLLSFKGETFESLIFKLQRWYNVEIVLQNDSLKQSRLTGAFDNETIEQALEALRLIAPFSYTIKENRIVIY